MTTSHGSRQRHWMRSVAALTICALSLTASGACAPRSMSTDVVAATPAPSLDGRTDPCSTPVPGRTDPCSTPVPGRTDLYGEAAAALLDCMDDVTRLRRECSVEPDAVSWWDVGIGAGAGLALGLVAGVLLGVVAAR